MKKFNHDCDSCIFLGAIEINQKKGDCYFCPKGMTTVLVRFSDEDGDYTSSLPSNHVTSDPFMGAATGLYLEYFKARSRDFTGQWYDDKGEKIKMQIYK